MAILRLVSIFAMWGNFCGQNTLCMQIRLEIPLPAGKQCAEISRYAGNSRIGGYAADINIDAKVLFQAAYQLHHAQGITAECEEAVIGSKGDAGQDFPENGADNGLDLVALGGSSLFGRGAAEVHCWEVVALPLLRLL